MKDFCKVSVTSFNFNAGVWSSVVEFNGRNSQYVLKQNLGVYEEHRLAFWKCPNYPVKINIGYKCVDNVAKLILLPPDKCRSPFPPNNRLIIILINQSFEHLAVFIVHEPEFDGDYVIWSYGTPTGGILSCKSNLISSVDNEHHSHGIIDGGGRNYFVHDIYTTLG
ncbi:hypothetical protein BX600DRAFT_59164 [Xylariales sp. PMI_506]|nr:hypothetical protein BX600DRAFT_59164 [Xylariales sp. PMI_506]